MQPVQAIIIRKSVFFTSRKFNRHIYKERIFLRSTSSLTSSIGIKARTSASRIFRIYMNSSTSKSNLAEDLLPHERNPLSKREYQAGYEGQLYPKGA